MTRKITLQQAQAAYCYRFTMEHMPQWASQERSDGTFYAPQYSSDLEWYQKTVFPGEPGLHGNCKHCESSEGSWPLGKALPAPYRVQKAAA